MIDAFKGSPNNLGFFVGNEVANDNKSTVASAYVKALLRDTKNYISSIASRKIPVGLFQLWERIDFFGINLYEWCGPEATYQNSGYADRTKDIASYSIPVFLSKFGCNLVSPRTFPEVKSIFGHDMANDWSGSIIYEWSQEDNKYDLVQIQPDNTVSILPDYTNLKKTLAPLHPKGVKMDALPKSRPPSSYPPITT
ncbi:hypothetical protein BGZ65_008250 [Modicella reniformis]|uniref:1,3-beta-glucanosyltransferase n=1 Tax=Modicella reniformis TaxID=1440133 RepID=A0A9P6IUA6_9FUNG|nr:hypothetical protein BGZ65_008250 [Modicella reniformis]